MRGQNGENALATYIWLWIQRRYEGARTKKARPAIEDKFDLRGCIIFVLPKFCVIFWSKSIVVICLLVSLNLQGLCWIFVGNPV